MSKHTPGPWTTNGKAVFGPPQHKPFLIASTGFDVADTGHEANARLIAAAPELLRALDAATCPVWVHNAAHTNNIEALRAIALWYADWNNNVRLPAIAKAEGQD